MESILNAFVYAHENFWIRYSRGRLNGRIHENFQRFRKDHSLIPTGVAKAAGLSPWGVADFEITKSAR
jgi:hypothetical protein